MPEQGTLFEDSASQPLAARIRPRTLEEYCGQKTSARRRKDPAPAHRKRSDRLHDLLGTAGRRQDDARAHHRAAHQGDVHRFFSRHKRHQRDQTGHGTGGKNRRFGGKTILFVDEIHRFNKAQQDAFLPFVEKGSIILIGATTENPSFEINGALLSRCKVFVLHALSADELCELLHHALKDKRGFGNQEIEIAEDLIRRDRQFRQRRCAQRTFHAGNGRSQRNAGRDENRCDCRDH